MKLIKHHLTYLSLLTYFLMVVVVRAQQSVYKLDASQAVENVREGYFQIGEHKGASHLFGVNNSYFTKDGKPWFPVMGEFHFERFPNAYWEEEILKMKSAGLSIVATYVFWNAHENPKGTWDWTGDRDLRQFLELCQKHGMYVWLRIGPWCHGEQLHGGHPDWIAKMPGKRSNAPAYVMEVEKLYGQIGQQTKGLFYKEGGPILGVQLENEYASGQAEHMDTLKKIALEADIVPVYFTITANTVFRDSEFEFLPLQGAYPYRGWTKGGGGPTKDFLYGNDQWIMEDALGKLYYDPKLYPRGLCEQGCGGQMKYTNRFTVEPHVVEAHLQNQIGRGMNLIGYYMFHGGTQIPGLKEPGYPESYDFQAPIGEFGLIRPSYRFLKILHHFINDYGEELAPMHVVYPPNPVTDEKNTDSLRYVVRVNGNSGFLFIGNTQVRIPMSDKTIKFSIKLPGETLEFPKKPFVLKGEATAILPFNLRLKNKALLKYATAQPLAKIKDSEQETLFLVQLDDAPVELAFDLKTVKTILAEGWQQQQKNGLIYLNKDLGNGEPITVEALNGKKSTLIIVNRQQAENSWRTKLNGKESIIFTKANVIVEQSSIELRQMGNPIFEMAIYPEPETDFSLSRRKISAKSHGVFRRYTIKLNSVAPKYSIEKIKSDNVAIQVPKSLPEHCSDLVVNIHYLGGSASAMLNDQIVTDHLFHGSSWQLGLKRYINEYGGRQLTIAIVPWSDKITGVAAETIKEIKEKGSRIKSLDVLPQYTLKLKTSSIIRK